MSEEITRWLISQGAIGIMAMLSMGINIVLWRENKSLRYHYDAIQESRLNDAREDRRDRLDVDRRTATSLELINEKIRIGKEGQV